MTDAILALTVLVVFMILWIIAVKVERDIND
jgi:flagellar biosynthesis/type III secretory pathway M-ring protein FliF/YscJ